MISYSYRLKRHGFLSQIAGSIGRQTDCCLYEFVFELVPICKIAQPDEAYLTETHRIIVQASQSQINWLESRYEKLPDAIDRMLYWTAQKALEDGSENCVFDAEGTDAKVDLSRVVIPQEPFEIDLPGPKMGFHALR